MKRARAGSFCFAMAVAAMSRKEEEKGMDSTSRAVLGWEEMRKGQQHREMGRDAGFILPEPRHARGSEGASCRQPLVPAAKRQGSGLCLQRPLVSTICSRHRNLLHTTYDAKILYILVYSIYLRMSWRRLRHRTVRQLQ